MTRTKDIVPTTCVHCEAALSREAGPFEEAGFQFEILEIPGHSPGHVCVRIRSEGLDAFITGDMVHHPFQFANAEWSMASVDYDSDAATATRARVYGEVADQPVLVIGTHFAVVTSGRVKRDGGSYRFDAE